MKLRTIAAHAVGVFRTVESAAIAGGPNTLEELFTARYNRGQIDLTEYSDLLASVTDRFSA